MSGSRALNGSSSRPTTSGSQRSARATPTRCCIPPDSWSGLHSRRPRARRASAPTSWARRWRLRYCPCPAPQARRRRSDDAAVGEEPEVLEDHRDGVAPQVAKLRDESRGHHVVTDDLVFRDRLDEADERPRESVDYLSQSPMTTNASPGQTSSATVLDGDDAPGLGPLLGAWQVDAATRRPLAVRSEDLPDPRRHGFPGGLRTVDATRCLESWLGGLGRRARRSVLCRFSGARVLAVAEGLQRSPSGAFSGSSITARLSYPAGVRSDQI